MAMTVEFLERLRRDADAKQTEETAYRQESRRRLEPLEAERARGSRRSNVLKDPVDAGAARGLTAGRVGAPGRRKGGRGRCRRLEQWGVPPADLAAVPLEVAGAHREAGRCRRPGRPGQSSSPKPLSRK